MEEFNQERKAVEYAQDVSNRDDGRAVERYKKAQEQNEAIKKQLDEMATQREEIAQRVAKARQKYAKAVQSTEDAVSYHNQIKEEVDEGKTSKAYEAAMLQRVTDRYKAQQRAKAE